MGKSINARLKRLEADAERPHLTVRAVWAEDDPEPTPGLVIRLRWGDEQEAP